MNAKSLLFGGTAMVHSHFLLVVLQFQRSAHLMSDGEIFSDTDCQHKIYIRDFCDEHHLEHAHYRTHKLAPRRQFFWLPLVVLLNTHKVRQQTRNVS
jgi:hypothetical protein